MILLISFYGYYANHKILLHYVLWHTQPLSNSPYAESDALACTLDVNRMRLRAFLHLPQSPFQVLMPLGTGSPLWLAGSTFPALLFITNDLNGPNIITRYSRFDVVTLYLFPVSSIYVIDFSGASVAVLSMYSIIPQ